MFMRATSFNSDLSNWDVTSVADMTFMFMRTISFNGDLSKWDVASVSDMAGMFRQAHAFNCDLSIWDVSSVTNMDDMFLNAVSFNQKLCGANWFRSKAKYRKSGRVSCCAPGGAWFKNCGGLGSKNVDHRWSEGVKACKRKFKANHM